MADTIIQLPYQGATSGDLLDATLLTVGANSVKRERMVIANDASTAVALVTSSGTVLISGVVSVGTVNSVSNIVFGYIAASTAAGGIVTGTTDRGLKVDSTQPLSLSSGTVTLSSPTSLSSGIVNTLTSGVYLVNATSTGGLLVDGTRGVVLVTFNFTATSSGLKSLVAASGSLKVKLVSYVVVSNSTQELAFYSSNTAIGASSSAPMVLSSYTGISAAGGRDAWLIETSAAGNLQVHLGNAGIVAGHGAYFYEV